MTCSRPVFNNRDDEAKNKNDINEENEKASYHETNYCHCKYDAGCYDSSC